MPHMSGAELVKRLGGRAPVLFMTGYTAELVEHNGTSLLQKPFTAVELTRKIRELLDRAAADAA
jgi:DNA-binding response OmpR family regulator